MDLLEGPLGRGGHRGRQLNPGTLPILSGQDVAVPIPHGGHERGDCPIGARQTSVCLVCSIRAGHHPPARRVGSLSPVFLVALLRLAGVCRGRGSGLDF